VSRRRDVVVVGGGPVGLAFAAAAAGRGLDVTVVEPRPYPIDKACGEGLMPAGVRALEALGVRQRLGPADASPLRAIRWIEVGRGAPGLPGVIAPCAEARLPPPGGLGVRRTALSAALLARAREAGAEVLAAEVLDHRRGADEVRVRTGRGGALGDAAGDELRASLLVAADGLASRVRRREGLDAPVAGGLVGPGRFGLRRHVLVDSPGDAVEVHLGAGVEAYLTPAGAGRLGVAFLFRGRAEGGWAGLLAHFPGLAARLAGASFDSEPLGAGPLARGASALRLDRLVLLGDAAGYLDALTGEGLSLGLACALDLAALAPAALARGATRESLLPYEAAWRRRFEAHLRWTRLLLALTRRPWLRRRALGLGAAWPATLSRLVAAAIG
jgi:2-polyprenyl-6-methoxyphenol hydroxylase-like FAD-dependent oxidoreductase